MLRSCQALVRMRDVVVVGSGPAGWAAAAACRAEGLEVTLVAPEPEQPFTNGYGVWVDEVREAGFDDIFSRTWPSARVFFPDGVSRRFERAYGRVDNAALRARLVDGARGVHLEKAEVRSVVLDTEDGFHVHLEPEATLHARMVIDASGHESGLVAQREGPSPGWQVAFGRRLVVPSGHPFELDEAVLMDFRPAHDAVGPGAWPSFLYALPEDERTVFVEETSLVARPPLGLEALEARLDARLVRMGVRPQQVLEVERCFIPMGGPPPPGVQPVVAFGGAARMVHPATGYLLARILRTAPILGRAVREALESGASRGRRSEQAWGAVWPSPLRRSHELYRFGTEVLLGLDTRQLAEFFAAFFALPNPEWQSYMSGMAGPGRIQGAMLGVFRRAEWSLRWRLVRTGLGREGAVLRRALLGQP